MTSNLKQPEEEQLVNLQIGSNSARAQPATLVNFAKVALINTATNRQTVDHSLVACLVTATAMLIAAKKIRDVVFVNITRKGKIVNFALGDIMEIH